MLMIHRLTHRAAPQLPGIDSITEHEFYCNRVTKSLVACDHRAAIASQKSV